MEFFLEKYKKYLYLDSSESANGLPKYIYNFLVVSPICSDTIKTLLEENQDLIFVNSKHTYYYSKKRNQLSHEYITFIKKRNSQTYVEYYVIVFSRLTSFILCSFLTKLFAGSPYQRILRINGNLAFSPISWSTIQAGKPYIVQERILNAILNHWKNNDLNSKIIISGPSQSGKLNIGSLLKIYIEYYDLHFKDKTCVNLFDNIDLSLQFDLSSIIENWCSEETPVIMTVRDIDTYYQNSMTSGIYNPKSPVYNKISFNNFLDSLECPRPFISIFTTKLTKEELEKITDDSGNQQSYSRKGRVDLFIRIELNSISVTEM